MESDDQELLFDPKSIYTKSTAIKPKILEIPPNILRKSMELPLIYDKPKTVKNSPARKMLWKKPILIEADIETHRQTRYKHDDT